MLGYIKPKEELKNNNTLSKNIKMLLKEVHISEAELGRQASIPQTTINRLLTGETSDPRASTLIPIANFFKISINELLDSDLASNRSKGLFNPTNTEAYNQIPIINWDEAPFIDSLNLTLFNHEKWITTEKSISKNSFALVAKVFMEPRFRVNSILIFDSNIEKKTNSYACISINNENITIKKVLIEGEDIYLKHLDSSMPIVKYSPNKHTIHGVIIETRMNL